jgi:hypothetical protein
LSCFFLPSHLHFSSLGCPELFYQTWTIAGVTSATSDHTLVKY